MPEDRADYVVKEGVLVDEYRELAELLEKLELDEAYAHRLCILAERHYRSVPNELRWIIDQAYADQVVLDDLIQDK